MNASETPVEALAFSFLSFGCLMAINNVWTWIAVVTTAAVSVWRVRTSSPSSPLPESLNEHLFPSSLAAEQPESSVVTTAAVSVWRVRTSSPSSPLPESLNESLFPSSLVAEQPESSISFNSAVVCSPTAVASTIFERETRTSRSRKFTVYYQEDENDYEDDVVVDAVKSDDINAELFPVEDNWEPMMKLRMENYMGLYSYQDLSVLDGSIVRLWEGCRRRN